MQGDPAVLELLNGVLTSELTAVNQYFAHAKLCHHWGYERLAEKVRAESIDEMKHVEELADRILYLEGMPNFQRLYSVRVGETVPEPRACVSATTAPASSSPTCWSTRKSTPTGSRPSSRPSARSASRTT